jgi:hypothetical protein
LDRSGAGLAFKPEEAPFLVKSIKIPAGPIQEERDRRGRNGKEVDLTHLSIPAASENTPDCWTPRLDHPGTGVLFS